MVSNITSVLDEPTFIWYIDPTAHSKFWSYIFCIDMCIIYIYDIIWSIMHLTWLYQWHDYINGQSSCFSVGLETDHFSTRSPASQGWVGWSPSWCQRVSWAKLLGPLGLGLRWTLRVKAAPYHRKFWGSMTMHFEGEVVDFNLPTFLLDWSGCMHVYAACWACTFAKQ